jgi:hypothetical protein
MNSILSLTPSQRAELFQAAAQRHGMGVVIVEKDFWVCWTLRELFSLPEIGEHLLFKGGTSLSKVWRIIERFSEDIDISLSRDWLGFGGDADPERAGSGGKQRERIDALVAACIKKIKSDLLPALRARAQHGLGETGCLDSINVGIDAVIADVRHHLPEFLAQFGAKLKEANDYVFAPPAAVPEPAIAAEGNVVRWHGFDIELASVHAVKGQTHTATLYFETAYHADGKGPAAKSYESQRLASQFLGQPFGASVPTRVQQSAKMVYVGFSRPTHLLCFAVHKQRFNAGLAAVAGNAWEVVDLG